MSMKRASILHEAWVSMGATKMRSFLTMLGIIIGVTSVVLMLAIGEGAQAKIKASIASMGSNLFVIYAGSTSSSGVRMGSGSAQSLKAQDAQDIAGLPGAAAVSAISPGAAQAVYNAQNWNTSVYGVGPDFLSVREWALARGANFTEADNRSASNVALIGTTVQQNLFADGEDPVGKTIRIKNIPFDIVGVLATKGQSLNGQDQDDVILIPLTTAQRKLFGGFFRDTVRMIMVKAESSEAMNRLERSMRDMLRSRHRLAEDVDDDFTIRNLTAVAESAESAGQTMSILLGSIASISLLVGGIGIMNIMLVSVTERTREIGIRKAIGSYDRDILLQFLLEAVIISITGGLIGMMLGIGGAYIASWGFDIDTEVSVMSLVLSFIVSASVGIFFGYYPAQQAARLSPIEALRYQ